MAETTETTEPTTKTYVVTDVGGQRPMIANRRSRINDRIQLTDAQAEFELSRGVVRLETPEDHAKD